MLKRKKPLAKNRKPIRRKKPLARHPLVRTALRQTRKKIRAKGKPRFARGRDPQYLEWIRGLPCLLTGRTFWLGWPEAHRCFGRVEAAHVKSRGAAGADVGNVVPLCHREHEDQHALGIRTWATAWFVGGLAELRRIAAETYPEQYEKAVALGWRPDAVGF